MPDDWSMPQIFVDDDGSMSVGLSVGDNFVDVTQVDDPDVVEDIGDAVDQGVTFDVSGNDISGIHISVEDFKDIIQSSFSDQTLSGNDLASDPVDLQPFVVDGDDISTTSFNPQAWQINMAENRPIGWHYVMTRTGSNSNNYILVLGRDVTYQDGLYTYQDADFYSVYQTGSSGNVRYHYDVRDHYSGSISSTSYVVYSDLYFDYIGSRSVSYSWLIVVFIALIVLLLIFFRGNRN